MYLFNALDSVNHQVHLVGNPNDSDSILTSHRGGYDNSIKTLEQFCHLK